jgi:hypothetical protein
MGMTSWIDRRRAVAVTLVVAGLLVIGGRGEAFAAQGDPYLDQCFATATVGRCAQTDNQIGSGVVMHPNQQWIYVSSTGNARINLYDRGARGQVARRAGATGCVTPDGSGGACTSAPGLATNWDLFIDKDGRTLYAPGSGTLVAFSINQSNGALTKIDCLGVALGCKPLRGGTSMFAGVVDPVTSTSAYVRVTNGLLVFTRAADGTLTQKAGAAGCMTEADTATCTKADGLGSQAFQLSVAPDGGAVYTTTQSPGGVTIFQRAPDGTLLQPNGPAGGCITTDGSSAGTANRCVNSGNGVLNNSWSTTLDATGTQVYVGTINGVVLYSRNVGTGLLTQVDCYVEGADSGGCKGRTGVRALRTALVPGGSEFVTADNNGRFGFLLRDGNGRLTNRAAPRSCVAPDDGGGACQVVPTLSSISKAIVSADGLNVYASSGSGTFVTLQRDFAPVCQDVVVDVPHNTAVNLQLNCSDANQDQITLQKVANPLAGRLADVFDQAASRIFYDPFSGFTGSDSFTFRGVARGIASAPATVGLRVAAPPAGGGGGGGGGIVQAAGIDNDKDGFFAGQDCNDNDAAIRPGAVEVKGNRLDENCDGLADPFPTLTSGVASKWDVNGSRLTLTSLQVTQQFPKGWKAVIKCSGKPKCSFRSTALKAGKVKRGAATVISKLSKKQRKFKAGQTVEVWVSAPGFNTKVARLKLRKGKIPTTQPFCVVPGETKPKKTCS